MKKTNFLFVILLGFVLSSCSEYQKLLKSNDAELKYNKAIEFYNKQKYMQAQSLLDDVSNYYKGTDRSEDVLNYLSKSYLGQKDYYTASEYYKTYVRTFPRGKYTAEAKYMVGYCYYLDSPDVRLDQAVTKQAIVALQEFIDIYPTDERVPQAVKQLDELNDKLAYKEFLSAKLYYNLGNYIDNNYLSAVITAQNALKIYPSTNHREDLSLIILESKYAQAVYSIEAKKMERYQDTLDEYYSFVNEFPEGKKRSVANKIFKEVEKVINK